MSGWEEVAYAPARATALVSRVPGSALKFRPGPGEFELLVHKHAWSGVLSIEVGGSIVEHDLHDEDARAQVPIRVNVINDQTVTIRSIPRISGSSFGQEVWLTGAVWKERPAWVPTPDPQFDGESCSGPVLRLKQKEILREFSCGDDPLDIFDGYAWLNGVRRHVCRRWFGQRQDRVGDFHNSRVVVSGQDVEFGDDPRVFTHQGKLAVVVARYSSLHGFRNHLLVANHDSGWERYYLMPPKGIEPGKNWSPFEDGSGRLNFVHSFSPLMMLREIRREAGVILLEALQASGLEVEEGPDNFPPHRGGSNGLRLGHLVVGIGHTTRFSYDKCGVPVRHPHSMYPQNHQLVHRPFGWVLNPGSLKLASFSVEFEWDQRSWIIDPTSFYWNPIDGRFELVTVEVERNFSDPSSSARAVVYQLSASDLDAVVASSMASSAI